MIAIVFFIYFMTCFRKFSELLFLRCYRAQSGFKMPKKREVSVPVPGQKRPDINYLNYLRHQLPPTYKLRPNPMVSPVASVGRKSLNQRNRPKFCWTLGNIANFFCCKRFVRLQFLWLSRKMAMLKPNKRSTLRARVFSFLWIPGCIRSVSLSLSRFGLNWKSSSLCRQREDIVCFVFPGGYCV